MQFPCVVWSKHTSIPFYLWTNPWWRWSRKINRQIAVRLLVGIIYRSRGWTFLRQNAKTTTFFTTKIPTITRTANLLMNLSVNSRIILTREAWVHQMEPCSAERGGGGIFGQNPCAVVFDQWIGGGGGGQLVCVGYVLAFSLASSACPDRTGRTDIVLIELYGHWVCHSLLPHIFLAMTMSRQMMADKTMAFVIITPATRTFIRYGTVRFLWQLILSSIRRQWLDFQIFPKLKWRQHISPSVYLSVLV